ncbi:integration host factor subunit beta [Desulfosarcina alkanivorans]|uniref:Integration host factor subunit beta n=1 Tax=Desulfosarcina alkanivorans TaxID=571177 RepID=A0A5K7YVE1_9BACT|nr:HU family DNA-binding protein [Desulfosarcina alkanivorans]BBO68637.1 integration host factor subunit beta [Desulfosarcina alkanivorans]
MNRFGLIQALKAADGRSRTEAESVVNLLFNTIIDALMEGGRVEIRGRRSIFVKEYQSDTGPNPKTGEPFRITPE